MSRGNRNINKSRYLNIRRRHNTNRRRRGTSMRRYKTGSIHQANISRVITAYPYIKSDWLAKLTWAGSMALRLYKTISAAAFIQSDSLLADIAVTTNAGQVMLLGPADFASVSPFVISCFDNDTAKKLTSFITYERMSLPNLSVRIFPCVDVSQRAGMYAAYLQQLDYINDTVSIMLERFSAEYEQVVKHPNVKVGPTSKPLNLQISRRAVPIAPFIEEGATMSSMPGNYYNRDPWYVLVVAFSDLATKTAGESSAYSQERAAFEIHLKGNLKLYNPSPVNGTAIANKTILTESMVTERISNLDPTKISYRFYNYRFEADADMRVGDLDPEVLNKIDSLIDANDLEIIN